MVLSLRTPVSQVWWSGRSVCFRSMYFFFSCLLSHLYTKKRIFRDGFHILSSSSHSLWRISIWFPLKDGGVWQASQADLSVRREAWKWWRTRGQAHYRGELCDRTGGSVRREERPAVWHHCPSSCMHARTEKSLRNTCLEHRLWAGWETEFRNPNSFPALARLFVNADLHASSCCWALRHQLLGVQLQPSCTVHAHLCFSPAVPLIRLRFLTFPMLQRPPRELLLQPAKAGKSQSGIWSIVRGKDIVRITEGEAENRPIEGAVPTEKKQPREEFKEGWRGCLQNPYLPCPFLLSLLFCHLYHPFQEGRCDHGAQGSHLLQEGLGDPVSRECCRCTLESSSLPWPDCPEVVHLHR